MSTTNRQPPALIRAVDAAADQFAASLPATIPSQKFVRTLKNVLQRDKALMECSPKSVMEAAMRAAADGLMLDGREAALVVFNSRDGKQATYIPMVAGILKRARNSGDISTLSAHTVHKNDRFEYVLGDEERIVHEPNWDDRGAIIGAYAICVFKDGGIQREFMSKAAIDKIRAGSRGKDNAPWKEHFDEMARKTVLRRLSKYLPAASDLNALYDDDDDEPRATPGHDAETGEIIDAEVEETPAGAAAAVAAAVEDKSGEPRDGDVI